MILLLIFSSSSISGDKKESLQEQQETETINKADSSRPWWIGDLITIFGIVVGAGLILYQLGRQHKNELRIQQENYREKLRLEIYQEFSKVLEEANDKTSDVGMYAFIIPTHFKVYMAQLNAGLKPAPLRARAREFSNKHSNASNSIIKLIRLFEKYEIISPELDIFKLAIIVANYDIREAFQPLFNLLSQMLPIDIVDNTGNTQLANIRMPSPEQMIRLDDLVGKYKNAEDDLRCYLFDLNIELQNIFLRNLFNNEVKRRNPLDPKIKVITTNPEDMIKLRKYFNEETAWGKSAKKTEEGVRNALNNP